MSIGGGAGKQRLGFVGAFGAGLQERVRNSWLERPSWLLSIGIGVGATALAKLLRAPFEPFLQGTAPLMPFLPVTLLTGYASGGRAGFVSLALGFMIVLIGFRSRPLLRSDVEATAALIGFVVIGAIGLILAVKARSSRISVAASEREKAAGEARYKLLSQEFQHRLSNLVTVASSLAAMSARRGGSAEDMLARLQPRLAAYARAQDLARHDRLTAVSLSELVETALRPFLQADEANVVIEPGEPVILPAATVTPLTLALHELATNALKHGALKTDGVVRVSWRHEISSRVLVTWDESGGPLVEKPTRTGFGSALIEDAFQRVAGGSASVFYRQEGVRCEFRLPCDRNASPSHPASRLSKAARPF